MANETLREGRYVILRPLGEGSQGTTFEAVDKREGRLVAVKRFSVRGARAWKDVELAEREARVLASLEHPQLPAYVEHFDEDGHLGLRDIAGRTHVPRADQRRPQCGEMFALHIKDARAERPQHPLV